MQDVRIEALMTPHKWFAWHPVIVERRLDDGTVVVRTVFLKTVTRTLVRLHGVSLFKYEVKL